MITVSFTFCLLYFPAIKNSVQRDTHYLSIHYKQKSTCEYSAEWYEVAEFSNYFFFFNSCLSNLRTA